MRIAPIADTVVGQEVAARMELEEASTASPAAALREIRPAADRLEMEDVRARAERALFGASESARLGRYVLLGRIAGGGMGVVYGAYDPDLHRKVALKVLHPHQSEADRGHQRLIGEARALAKLDHPNVVKVHDVLTHGGQVVVVMALVEGSTLAEWQLARPRSWREIVAAYRQAGEGLAAAHDVGVVHRDFKPANAIIEPSGRVQVLDFGLARMTGAEPIAFAPAGDGALDLESTLEITALTATGQVVGTLGYISPEQLDGAAATPASDQFSFCVSLHRALEGVAPFAGSDPAGLRESIGRGVLRYASDGRDLPKWLRGVVGRGLAAAPRARYPSMRALLEQLGRERGWRRWRRTVIAVASVIAVGVGVFAARGPSIEPAPCDGGATEIAAVWNGVRRLQIGDRLRAIVTPYGRDLETRIPEALDGYQRTWSQAHRDACTAYRRGAQSSDLFDRRMLCLQRHLDDLAATVQVLRQIDERSITKAIEVVAGMPPVAECADGEALMAASAPPATSAVKQEVAAIRTELSRAAALDRSGRDRDALQVAEGALARARRASYPPVEVEASLREGQILLFSHDYKAALAPLGTAETLALENGMYASAVEAAARRLFCEGIDGAAVQDLEPRIAWMEALGRGLRADHFARPLLLNNVGVIYIASGRREAATRYFGAARAALAGVAQPDLELVTIERNLAMVTGDQRERESLIRGAWERLDRELGSAHPLTVEALEDYARYTMDPVVAANLETEACRLYAQFYPAQIIRRAVCMSHVAFLTAELGDQGGALAQYAAIVALTSGATDEDAVVWGQLARGQLHLARGEANAAIAEFTPVVERHARSDHWWERQWASHALLGIGQAEYLLGSDDQAITHLEAAGRAYLEFIALTEEVENHQRLAQARLALAAALQRRGGARARALQLGDQAREFYRAANPLAYRWRLAATLP